jgi:hypothetical protein
MNFQFNSTVSDRALLAQFHTERTDWTMAIETELVQHPRIGADVERVFDAVIGAAEAVARVAPDRSPEGLAKEGRARTDAVAGPYNLLVEAARREADHVESETVALYTPRHPEGSDPAMRVARAEWWRSLSMPQRLDAAKRDLAVAQAVVEFGKAGSGLPDEVWDRLHRDMAAEQLAQRILHDNSLRTEPTVDEPLGGAPDIATARKNAAEKLDRLDDERDMLARVPILLGNVITAVSLMSGETRADAFARLSA